MNIEPVIITGTENIKPEKRVWGFWPTVGFGAVVLTVFVIVQVLVVVVYALAVGFSELHQASGTPQFNDILNKITDVINGKLGLLQSIATIVSGIICTGLIWLFIRARKRAGIKEYLGLNKISWKTALLVLGVVIGLILVLDIIIYFVLGQSTSEGIVTDIYDTSVWPPLFWIAVVIFAPLFEEAFFRGFLFEGFRQSPLGSVGAIIFTAIGWALLHALQYQLASIIWIFVLGIVMGVVRLKTRSIWSTFIMHAFVNLAATAEIALKLSIALR